MLSTYKEALEVNKMSNRLNDLKNDALDLYYTNPKKCSEMLKMILELDKDVEELSEDYNKLLKII